MTTIRTEFYCVFHSFYTFSLSWTWTKKDFFMILLTYWGTRFRWKYKFCSNEGNDQVEHFNVIYGRNKELFQPFFAFFLFTHKTPKRKMTLNDFWFIVMFSLTNLCKSLATSFHLHTKSWERTHCSLFK